MKTNILILGASYGSLLGIKLLMAGHRVTLVCTAPTARLINEEGIRVRFPIRGKESPLEIASSGLPGTLCAATPTEIDPAGFDLVVLAMQEAHYGSPGVSELLERVARARKPCLAIMNMPPPPYLARLGLDPQAFEACYADAGVWDGFEPGLITLASPDPQAFRPPEEAKNVLQVGLPTNFKAARFDAGEPTALLRILESGIEAARHGLNGSATEVPVKLKVHESIFVPLAKWPMLIAGNYRCIRREEMIPIRIAVHADLAESRRIYEWVSSLCMELGADAGDLVPFEKYAKAAESLGKPSSAARALFSGAKHIERVDSLVQRIAEQRGRQCDVLDEIVTLVDERLERNRGQREARKRQESVVSIA